MKATRVPASETWRDTDKWTRKFEVFPESAALTVQEMGGFLSRICAGIHSTQFCCNS